MFIIIKNNALCNCSFPNIIHANNGENFLHCKADLYNKASLNKLEFSFFLYMQYNRKKPFSEQE